MKFQNFSPGAPVLKSQEILHLNVSNTLDHAGVGANLGFATTS